jgi:uncharacterized protein
MTGESEQASALRRGHVPRHRAMSPSLLCLSLLSACLLVAPGPAFAAGAGSAGNAGTSAADDGKPETDRFGAPVPDIAFGAFQRGLYITALNLALPDAESGDAASQMLVAEIYARGLGVARNLEEATRWYMAAAESGDPGAQLQAGLILLGDKPLDRANDNRSEALSMLKASADAGNPFAAFNLAQLIIADKPGDEGQRAAAPLFGKAAAKGIPGAHYALSRMHQTGSGGMALDGGRALEHLRRAARGGLDTAQLDLGTALVDGTLGTRDYAEGRAWLLRAAAGGNPVAAIRLAKVLVHALGVDPDPVAAGAWYIRAKRSGLTDVELDDFMEGLADDERAAALARANELG